MATAIDQPCASTAGELRPRVLIVVQNMSFSYDTRVQNIARSLVRQGCSVHVLCPRYAGDPPTSHRDGIDVDFFRVPTAGRGLLSHTLEYAWSLIAVARLARARCREGQFDVIHICNPPDFFFLLARAWRRGGARVIYDQHDLVPELFEARYGKRRLLVNMLKLSERLTVANADRVLVTSNRARSRMLSMHGLNRETVFVVPNAPDLARVPPARVASSPSHISVGYLGNMNPQDGVDVLLHAANFIRHTVKRRDVVFVCIGDGSSYRSLMRLRAELRLTNAVRFVGRRAPDAAWALLSACDICVQPDPPNMFTKQTMMAKATEYMALAKPVVAFDLPETRNVCGPAARYARTESARGLAEEILTLADNPTLRARLGSLGRSRAERLFNWRVAEEPLVRVYAKLVSGEDVEYSPMHISRNGQTGSRQDRRAEVQ